MSFFKNHFYSKDENRKFYFPIKFKFLVTIIFTLLSLCLTIYLSTPWLKDLTSLVGFPFTLVLVTFIAYIPCFISSFFISSLLQDRYISIENSPIDHELTILIAMYNEEDNIYRTLRSIKNQSYLGNLKIIAINNNSSDNTEKKVLQAKEDFGLNLDLVFEKKQGKFNALNTGLKKVSTRKVITVDADTILHHKAIENIVKRMNISPKNVKAVAGTILIKNYTKTMFTKIQYFDYMLGISSIKRMQGLFQNTLVAQGAFSIYDTVVLRELGGWSDAIGEDIILTWNIINKKYKVFYEPQAVAFTDAPLNLLSFQRQRSRWARGLIEVLKIYKPWNMNDILSKELVYIATSIPLLDFSVTFFWIPGVILAVFFQKYYIVGLMTLLVIPLNFILFSILFLHQKRLIFNKLNLKESGKLKGC